MPARAEVHRNDGLVVVVRDRGLGHTVRIALEHLTRPDVQRIVQERLDVDTPIEDIDKAVLEVDGTVTVVRRDQTMVRSNSRLPSRRVRRRYRPVGG